MMDIHAHSYHSDGSVAPAQIVEQAKAMGLSLCAVTDHDCIDGVDEALSAGRELGVAVLSGLEMDVVCDAGEGSEVHALGYGFDLKNKELLATFEKLDVARKARNEEILERLREIGAPVEVERDDRANMVSRTHIASGLVKAGYVATIGEAFSRYLGRHGAARVEMEHIRAADYIDMIHRAGGLVVLAHPGLIHGDMQSMIYRLAHLGLDGVEVYYPAHRAREIVALRKLADELNLFITSGSDYHGEYRAHIAFGLMAELASFDPRIKETEERLTALAALG